LQAVRGTRATYPALSGVQRKRRHTPGCEHLRRRPDLVQTYRTNAILQASPSRVSDWEISAPERSSSLEISWATGPTERKDKRFRTRCFSVLEKASRPLAHYP